MKTQTYQKLEKVPDAGTKIRYSQLIEALKHPLSIINDLSRKYSGLARTGIMHKKFIIVAQPVYFKYILKDHYKNFPKYDLSGLLTKILGHSLITNNGKEWLEKRRILQPVFHKKHLANYTSIIHSELDKVIKALKDKNQESPLEVCQLFMDLNLKVSFR